MPTYLLTWNPGRWPWHSLSDDAEKVAAGLEGVETERWSIGNRKSVKKGDRLFMLKQGKQQPKGIMAGGFATGEAFEDEHWEDSEKLMWYVPLQWDCILVPSADSLIETSTLKNGPLRRVHWDTQSSGIEVPDDLAPLLEDLWASHVEERKREAAKILADPDADAFPEGKLAFRMHRQRERSPALIAKAKALAKKKYKRLFCCACDFDFAARYGGLGEDFIEAHTRNPFVRWTDQRKPKCRTSPWSVPTATGCCIAPRSG
jgi:5-methylcytosine-specific restriction protein A